MPQKVKRNVSPAGPASTYVCTFWDHAFANLYRDISAPRTVRFVLLLFSIRNRRVYGLDLALPL